MKRFYSVLAVAILLATSSQALATLSYTTTTQIGINFAGGSYGYSTVTGTAGALPQANWNNIGGIGNTTNNLIDSNGNATSVSVTTTGGNTWSNNEPNDGGNGSLLSNFLDGGSGGQDKVTVSGLGGGPNTLYIYDASNQSSTNDFTVNGTTYYGINQNGYSDGVLYQYTPSLTPDGAQSGNWFVVPFTGTTLTIIANSNEIGNFRSSLDGIQIVTVSPEPTAIVIWGLVIGAGLIASRRLRKTT